MSRSSNRSFAAIQAWWYYGHDHSQGLQMQTIKASEFKAKCLALMDQVALSGKPLLVTKNGKPVAELQPHRPAGGSPLGVWKNQVQISGDIISPIDADWDALR
jgi:prevent-host-death family protein